MQIRLSPAIYQPVAECVTCGHSLEPDVLIASVHDSKGAEIGLICTRCRESEPETLQRTIQQRAGFLHQQAHTLEHLVSENHDILVS